MCNIKAMINELKNLQKYYWIHLSLAILPNIDVLQKDQEPDILGTNYSLSYFLIAQGLTVRY